MLKVAGSSALGLDLILADRFSRSEGIELDTADGAAGLLPADQFSRASKQLPHLLS
jgi:hypothetical protein